MRATAARKQRKLETRIRSSLIKVVQLLPDCEVCGQHMDMRFLRPWNDRRACIPCITELTAEVSDNVVAAAPIKDFNPHVIA